jgi:hypothetical protein
VATLQIGVVAVITILKKKLILEMYSLFSFRRYSYFGSSCFLVPDRSRTKEYAYPSEGVTLTQRESKLFEKEEEWNHP